MTHGTGTFEGKNWEEQSISEVEGAPKPTRAFAAGHGIDPYTFDYRFE